MLCIFTLVPIALADKVCGRLGGGRVGEDCQGDLGRAGGRADAIRVACGEVACGEVVVARWWSRGREGASRGWRPRGATEQTQQRT